jgi:hypothetical protein
MVAVAVVAAILVFNMDALVDFFRGHVEITALVPETSGVRPGSPVEVEGVQVGHVTAVGVATSAAQGAIGLTVRLEDRVAPVIRRGSRAMTAKRRFIGEPVVRISAGPADSPPVATGDTLYPAETVSLSDLIERGRDFPDTLDSLRTTLAEVQRLSATATPRLAALTRRLDQTMDQADAVRTGLLQGGLAFLDDPTFGARVRSLRLRTTELGEAAERLSRYAGDGPLRREGEQLAARAERLGTRLDRLQQGIDDGTLGRLRRDSALVNAMAEVTAQIDSLTAAGFGFALRMLAP